MARRRRRLATRPTPTEVRRRWPTIGWLALLVTCLGVVVGADPGLRAQDESSPDAVGKYRAAAALQNRQLYDLAAEEWRSFLSRHQDDALAEKARHYLGICYFELGKYAQAEAAFGEFLARHPESELRSSGALNLGLAQFNLGQQGDQEALRRALQTLQALVDQFPHSEQAEEAAYYLAESYYSLGQHQRAVQAHEEALRKYPQHAWREKLLYGLGVALQEADRTKDALAVFDRLLKDYPSSDLVVEVRMRRADALFAAGRYEEAERDFGRAAADAAFQFADYAQLRQAACHFQRREYRSAGRLYAELLKRFPQSAHTGDATVAAGKCFYLAGDNERAAQWLARATGLDGEDGIEAAHWLARTHLAQGQPQAALQVLEAALDRAVETPLRGQLEFDLADAMYELPERRAEAGRLYTRIAETTSDGELKPHALYMAAYAAFGRQEYAAAREFAELFLNEFTDHQLAPDVLAVVAESLLQQGQYAAARKYWTQLLDRFPERPERAQWIVRVALTLHLEGRHSQVVEQLASVVDQLPDKALAAEARFLLGAAYLEQGRPRDSIRALQGAVQADPNGPERERTYLLLAQAQQQADDFDHALATVDRFFALFPESSARDRALYRKAEIQYAHGDYPRAAQTYASLLREWPHSPLAPDAKFGLGWSQLSLKQDKQAAETFERFIDNHPDHALAPDARYAWAVALQRQNKFAAALVLIDEYLARSHASDPVDAHYVRGLCLAGLKEFDKAIRSFERALEGKGGSTAGDEILYELAWALDSSGQPAKAATTFGRLAKEHPASPLATEALYRVAEYFYDQQDFPTARTAYEAVLRQPHISAELGEKAAHKMGWSYFQEHNFPLARQAFAAQFERFGAGELATDALIMQAECSFQQKQFEDALHGFQQAVARRLPAAPLSALALLHAGQSAAQLGRWEESRELLRRCSNDFPDSDYIHEATYELAWAQQKLGDVNQAKTLFTKVADSTSAPVGARARFMVGELLFLEKHYDDAIREFFKVAYGYGHPDSPKDYHRWQANAMFEAARCCEATGRTTAAKRLYSELVELFPHGDKAADARRKLEQTE